MEKRAFDVTSELEDEIVAAIHGARKGKAAGDDGIFSEMFQASPELSAKLIISLWRACDLVKETPSLCNLIKLLPFYKKVGPRNPANYRPIAPFVACKENHRECNG